MTVLAPSLEEILEKLVRIARGDPSLVQEALGRAATGSDRPPTLEQVVDYILVHRKQAPQVAS
jgi:hypothetical protein